MSGEITIWEKEKDIILKTYGEGLTINEFNVFMQIGKSLDLNPFKKEIWAVKYGNQVNIFIARDGYRRLAQEQPTYDGHIVECVYENDLFELIDGKISHKFSFKNRGKIEAAYCEVYRKDISHPIRVIVKFTEYNSNQSLWRTKPETMIKKVAEAQALRMAFQGLFSGTYDESEQWEQKKQIETPVEVIEPNPVKHEKHVKQPEILPDPERPPLGDPDQLYDTIEKILASCIEAGTVHKSEVSKLTDSITKAYESGDVKQLLSYKAQLEGRGQSSASEKSGDSNEILILRKRILKGFGLLNYNEVHIQNSIKKYLEVENIADCHDVEKLRKLLDKLLFENDKKPTGTASQKQKNFIKMLCNSDEAMIDENLPEGVESIDQLTKEQASEMIARLQK